MQSVWAVVEYGHVLSLHASEAGALEEAARLFPFAEDHVERMEVRP